MRVLLVEDQQLLADALVVVLADEGIEVSVMCTGDEILDRLSEILPDLVLVDIGPPDRGGLEVGRRIFGDSYPKGRVVALTAMDAPGLMEEAIRRGFHTFLTKDTGKGEFVEGLRAIADGRSVRRPTNDGLPARERHQIELLIEQLTPRELDVLSLLTGGATTSEIAESLSISRHTVRSHVQNILAKLQLHSRLEAAAFATRHQLVDPRAGERPRIA
jgi:RNA polymerase sigma factor (sigma-70 family)